MYTFNHLTYCFPLRADARLGLEALSKSLPRWQAEAAWTERAKSEADAWRSTVDTITQRRELRPGELPYDGEVIGAVQRSSPQSTTTDIAVCAAGTLPAELHKLWRTSTPGGYHMEYGYSCMGYEIAGGLGVKMARPDREVIVMVGDGSYLMLNNEIATSVMLDKKLIIVLLDNRGYGCINRLQQHCGSKPFNNMLSDSLQFGDGAPNIDFAANAASLGALSEKVANIPELEAALQRARAAKRTYLICIDTDDTRTTKEGGWWWEVAVPEESPSESVRKARAAYLRGKENQKRLMNLVVKPKKDSQEIVSVTPASAGWRYISFSAHQLAPGETFTFSDTSNELCVVVLSGIVSAQTEGHDWKEIGGRMSVFEDASPYAVYLPPRAKLTITAKTDAELAVAGGPAKGELPVRLIEPAAMRAQRARQGIQYPLRLRHSARRMNPPSRSWSSKSGHRAETPRAIRPTSTTSTMSPLRACWRKPITIASILRRDSSSSVSIAIRAILTSRWPSRIATSFWCLVVTIPSSSLTATNPITSTSWQAQSASGISTTTPPTNGS